MDFGDTLAERLGVVEVVEAVGLELVLVVDGAMVVADLTSVAVEVEG